MTTITEKIQRLQALLEMKNQKGSEPPQDVPEVTAPQVEAEAVSLPVSDRSFTPPKLQGKNWQEILLLSLDGGLSESEEIWFATKTLPGRMPSLKYLSMLGETKIKGENK